MSKKTLKIRSVELGTGVPKTIVPIVAKTRSAIFEKAAEITKLPADLVEWRADFYEDLFNTPVLLETLKELRKILGEIPILFTIRTIPEGGEVSPTPEDYTKTNLAVAKSGDADIVDVEMILTPEFQKKNFDGIHQAGCLVVGSKHDFKATPSQSEIFNTLKREQDSGADIPKIAVMPQSDSDVITLLAASVEFNEKYSDRPFLTISMGPKGMVSRMACELSGSCMTFGAAGQVSAPGQIQRHFNPNSYRKPLS